MFYRSAPLYAVRPSQRSFSSLESCFVRRGTGAAPHIGFRQLAFDRNGVLPYDERIQTRRSRLPERIDLVFHPEVLRGYGFSAKDRASFLVSESIQKTKKVVHLQIPENAQRDRLRTAHAPELAVPFSGRYFAHQAAAIGLWYVWGHEHVGFDRMTQENGGLIERPCDQRGPENAENLLVRSCALPSRGPIAAARPSDHFQLKDPGSGIRSGSAIFSSSSDEANSYGCGRCISYGSGHRPRRVSLPSPQAAIQRA